MIGAGYAGLGAAHRLSRKSPGEVAVTLINPVPDFVERVRLHQLAAGQNLTQRPLTGLIAGSQVDLLIAQVDSVDVHAQRVGLDRGAGSLPYDTLIWATGSGPDLTSVPGVADHALPLASRGEAYRLRRHVVGPAAQKARVTVVGSGLTGIEFATELADITPRLDIQLLTSGRLGSWLTPWAEQYLRTALALRQISLVEHAPVGAVSAGSVGLADGREMASDVVVWATGFRAHPLAGDSGLAVDDRGRIMVDSTYQSVTAANVYAVGDAAAVPLPFGQVARMSCQMSLPMGQQVADIIGRQAIGQPVCGSQTPVGSAGLRYGWTSISLGRHDGLTQFSHPDDRPGQTFITGRPARRFKELVLHGTILALRHAGSIPTISPGSSRPARSWESSHHAYTTTQPP